MDIQRDIFPQRGSESTAKPQWALPVVDQVGTQITSTGFIAATDFTVPPGSAGSTVTIQLPIGPIVGNNGRTGYFGNSSLVLTGAIATTLATEVAFVANSGNYGGDASGLSNGQFMVDYEAGYIYGKRADSATTGTATYKYRQSSTVGSSGGTSNTNITQVGTVAVPTAGADGVSNTRSDVPTSARISGFNGTTWDRIRVGQTTPTATVTGFLNDLPWAIYNATPTTRTEAQGGPLQANSVGALNMDETMSAQAEDNTNGVFAVTQKPLAASTYAPTRFQNLGANATLNVKATTGNVFSLHCHNLNAADRYIQLHNTATTPGGAAVPLYSFRVPAGGNTQIGTEFFTSPGVNFSTGIAFAFSTTEATYTAATAGDQMTHVLYI